MARLAPSCEPDRGRGERGDDAADPFHVAARVGDCAIAPGITSDADALLPRPERRDARPGPLDYPCCAAGRIRACSSTGRPCRSNTRGRDWFLCRCLLDREYRRNAAALPRRRNRGPNSVAPLRPGRTTAATHCLQL